MEIVFVTFKNFIFEVQRYGKSDKIFRHFLFHNNTV